MRLRRLDLARYGKFTDRRIDFGEREAGAPDLHIIYGPNEAGKSTAFAAFLDLLFGIERQSRYGFLHPYKTMRVGGCLELSVGARDLVRIKLPQPTLRDAADQPVPEGLILGDLGGIDRTSYRTMFSLDDDTLEAGGESILASNGELGQLLFSASAGLFELSRTLTELRLESDGFTKPNARSGELATLKAALVTLKQERDAIDTLAADYNRLAAERDTAEARYQAALAERAEAQAALAQIQRGLVALPRLAALHQLGERLVPLADLPAAPAGWLDELPALEKAETRHRSEAELAAADVKRLTEELAAIIVDDRALRLAGGLDLLSALSARYRTAELDLPRRRQERIRAEGDVASILLRLGRPNEGEPARLLLNAPQSAHLSSLIAARSGIEAQVTAAAEELSQAEQAMAEARDALAGTSGSAPAPVLGPVIATLAALRESDHAIRLRAAAQARAAHGAALAARLAALAPWAGSVEALAQLTVPEPASVEAWHAMSQRHEAQVVLRREAVERLETEVAQRAAERAAIGKTAGLVSDEEAAAIRQAREAAWAAHRRTLDPVSADTFEAALRRDDIVFSARLGHERDLAKLHETTQALMIKEAEAARARALLEESAAEHRTHLARVAAAVGAITPALPADVSPAALLGWMARRDKTLDAADLLLRAERDLAEAEADAAALRHRLLEALRQAAVPVDASAETGALAATAQAAVDREARAQSRREAVAESERAVRARELAVQKAGRADQTWQTAWREACAACWLGESAAALPVATVREMLAAATALGPALKTQVDLADRIAAMEDDQRAFGQEANRLTAELGLTAEGRSSLDLAQAVQDRVEAARRAVDAQRKLQAALAAAEDRQRSVSGAALAHARRVTEMMTVMQADTLMALASRLRDAEQKADLERQAAQAEADILATLRVGSLAEARALLETRTEPDLEREQSTWAARFEDLDRRTRELFAASGAAGDRIARVGGDDAAARIEARRRTVLLEIEDRARYYLRLRVGIAAADRALRAYRDQNRSAMMTQASEAFRVISRGAYRGLGTQPDRDRDMLVALGADGGSKLVTDLSKGTRFQLYLALRAAGYQEFARLRPPVPFIADDIMETFDDFRAEETLRVFADMSRLGQVIYLTHHDHLCAIAERTVPGVRIHRLPS
jgi:uncharacterized protein YhaN